MSLWIILWLIIASTAYAGSIDVRGSRFPPDIYYNEGANESIALFRHLTVWTNQTITVDVSAFIQPANVRTVDLYATPSYYTGNNVSVNSYLSNLSVWLSQYENRNVYIELRFYSGEYSENAPVGTVYAGVYLYGVQNNTAPYIDGVLVVDVYIDGGSTIPQFVSSAFWNAFTDERDSYYDIANPGIKYATLECIGATVLVNAIPNTRTSIENAKAGSFSIKTSGHLTNSPICTFYVTDLDKSGKEGLNSERYSLSIVFSPYLNYMERFRRWSTSISGVLTWIGLAFGVFEYFSIIRGWNELVHPELYALTHRYRVNLWRFARKTIRGRIVGPEPLFGRWLGRESTYRFIRVADSLINRSLPYNDSVDNLFVTMVDSGNLRRYTGVWKWIMLPFATYYIPTMKYSDVESTTVMTEISEVM